MDETSSPRPAVLRACRLSFVGVGLFSFAINALLLTTSLYMLQVYDRVLTSRSLDTLLYLTLAALGAVLVVGALEMVRSRLLGNASGWLERTLAPRAFERSLSNSLHRRKYRIEALRDVREVRAFFAGPAVLVLFDAPWMPLFVGTIFLLHPLLGSVAAGAAMVLFVVAVLNDLAARKPLKTAGEVALRAMREVEGANRNAEVVDALGLTRALQRRWARQNNEALRLQTLANNRAGILVGASKSFRLAAQILMLATGAWLVIQQELTGGAMIAGSIILARALAPVEQAIGAWKQVLGARAAYRRLQACFAEPPPRQKAMPLPPPKGNLRLDRVRYATPGGTSEILKNVSLALAAGESMAVLGPSAAGKSTLARLLVGTYPPATGHVRLDGADLYTQDREVVGRWIGYLPQDVELIAGTVAENISRFAEDAEPEFIVDAAEMAGCHEMILGLPQGYDTEIGEGGAHLSGGQRQRIALARAVYGKPRLVVLDEPDANLDADGELALARCIAALKADGATVVLITHRPSFVQHVDKILVLRGGIVEMFGPRREVLERLRPRPVDPGGRVRAAQPVAVAAASLSSPAALQRAPEGAGP